MPRFFALFSLLLAASLSAGPATRPASISIADVTGTVREPLAIGQGKVAVLLFISTDCPISNGYAPEFNRIWKEYEPRGASFFMVHADPDLTDADAKKHAGEFGFACPVVVDRKHELVKRAGATMTPEAAIIDAGGNIVYRGRIDDLHAALGKRRYEATTHDLRAALNAVLAGKPVPTPRTMAVGCAIVGR